MCLQILVSLIATIAMIVIVCILMTQGNFLLGVVVMASYVLLMVAMWGS